MTILVYLLILKLNIFIPYGQEASILMMYSTEVKIYVNPKENKTTASVAFSAHCVSDSFLRN